MKNGDSTHQTLLSEPSHTQGSNVTSSPCQVASNTKCDKKCALPGSSKHTNSILLAIQVSTPLNHVF